MCYFVLLNLAARIAGASPTLEARQTPCHRRLGFGHCTYVAHFLSRSTRAVPCTFCHRIPRHAGGRTLSRKQWKRRWHSGKFVAIRQRPPRKSWPTATGGGRVIPLRKGLRPTPKRSAI